jgi:hypothetical protein
MRTCDVNTITTLIQIKKLKFKWLENSFSIVKKRVAMPKIWNEPMPQRKRVSVTLGESFRFTGPLLPPF